ncbi:MAG: membrane dipeptidase [Rikenellaceae bacterium]
MIFDFNKGFNDQPIDRKAQRPLIGVSANVMEYNSALHIAYSQAIVDAGGVPMIIPHVVDADFLRSLVSCVDGVLFSGGDDFDAAYFGDENIEGLTQYNSARDFHEFMLLRAALDCGLPVFGICRGFQLFNIALGGDIYQDLPSQYPTTPLQHMVLTDRHLGTHEAKIAEGSWLHRILQINTISVNSRHHQGVKNISPLLRAVAHTEDGLVEALEGYPMRKIMGVQWHPENMATTGESPQMKRLFEFFVGEARLYMVAREIHMSNPIVDSHCDTPMLYDSVGFDLAMRNQAAKIDIVKMEEGAVDATITVAYIPQLTPPAEATQKAKDILLRFAQEVSEHEDRVVIARSPKDVMEAKCMGKRSVMLAIENGLALGDDLAELDNFKGLGVSYITLCHNGSNQICDSAAGDKPYGGLSDFGRSVIERMNKLGITIDVSHSSHDTTMQAVEFSKQPIIASHSSCKSLCDHRRNLSDEAIRAIAAKGGVVQICGYGGFLRLDGEATICDLVAHIEYAVELVGYNHVGVGSDFDGDGGVVGFDGANEFMNLTVELLRNGHTSENTAKIMGGNILRVLAHNNNGGLLI